MNLSNQKPRFLFAIHIALVAVFAVIFFGLAITPANAATGWHIKDDSTGGDCSLIGSWDDTRKICTLAQNLGKGIVMENDNITLDGRGYTIAGTGTGNGIYIFQKAGVTVKNLNVRNFATGIFVYHTSFSTITGSAISFNKDYGIYLNSSNDNTVKNNTISNNSLAGLVLNFSPRNTLKDNTISNNVWWGMSISSGIIPTASSENNTLRGNITTGSRYNFEVQGFLDSNFDQDIDTSNTLDGKPIYYIRNATNQIFDSSISAGAFYCIWCSGITIKDLTFSKSETGVFLWKTNNSRLENIKASNNRVGINVFFSNNNIITDNNAVSNDGYGVRLNISSNNTIKGNVITNSSEGISLYDSNTENIIENNVIENSRSLGLYLLRSSRNTIIGNRISLSSNYGIILNSASDDNNLVKNTISNNLYGVALSSSNGNAVDNNNFIDNTTQAIIFGGSDNKFDLTLPYGGNYWSNYDTPTEGCNDTNNDGFCDSPYVFTGGQDNLPWTKRDGWVVAINATPTLSNLLQWDGATVISEGYTVRHPSIAFSANVSDPDGDQVKLQVELRRFEEPFTGNDDGGILTSNAVGSGDSPRVSRTGLSDGKYHWRARAVDSAGQVSEWQEFSIAGNVDFEILTNQPPVASFTFTPQNPKVGEAVTFDASSSYDPDIDGTIVLYGWDWDTDGVMDAYSDIPSIQYDGFSSGIYTVTLYVTDNKGAIGAVSSDVSVEPVNQSSASILDAFCSAFGRWWCGAEAYQNEKDIKKIDEWLRDEDGDGFADDGITAFVWLRGTRCSGVEFGPKQKECLISALNTQFRDNSGHDSGLTYKAYILSVIAEQEMVEDALRRLTPSVYPYKAFAKALLKWLPFSNIGSIVYNDITSAGVEGLLRVSTSIVGDSTADIFKFGSSMVSFGLNAKKINETFDDINDERYLMALGGYFRNRNLGYDSLTAWVQTSCGSDDENTDEAWWEKFFLTTNINECGPKSLLSSQMSQGMLDETEKKFEEWYQKYDIVHFKNAELLGNTFKQGLKDDVKALILFAVKKKNK